LECLISYKFRDALAHIGQRKCSIPEQFNAWSQNLRHDNPLTTFTSYGTIDPHRQGELIKGIEDMKEEENDLKELLSIFKS
jgi:hypothetical protein